MEHTIIHWIQNWYAEQCNGDWEHSYGVKINTLDNPGWDVEIDLTETDLEGLSIEYYLVEESETDWYGISVKDNVYSAGGDPSKLELLLLKFKELVEEYG